jgi:ribosomal-protein-alanine N-acetyltransferase
MNEIPILETPRLRLRPFELADAADVQRLAGDIAVFETTTQVPHPYKDGMAATWIASHRVAFAERRDATFAIVARADDSLLGAISLMNIATDHQAELGYWLGKPHWNHGYCSEAGVAALRFAFAGLGLRRVHATHMTRNPASGRVMAKIGMRHEGTRRQHLLKLGRFEDLELYGVLRSEWCQPELG